MISLSSSFIRKRVISLATTLSVGAASLALARGPTPAHHVHGPVAPMHDVADRSDDSGEAPFLPDGKGPLEPLAGFMTKPAGAAIINAAGPIRQIAHGGDKIQRRYLVIAQAVPTVWARSYRCG